MQATAQETITFGCPSCGAKLQVPAELAGETGPCPMCATEITAPQPTPPPRQATPEVARYQQPSLPLETPQDQGLPSPGVPEPEPMPAAVARTTAPPVTQDPRVPSQEVALDGQAQSVPLTPQDIPQGPHGLGVAMGLTQTAQTGQQVGQAVGQPSVQQAQAPVALEYSKKKQPFPWVLISLVCILLCAIGYLLWKMGMVGGGTALATPTPAEIDAVLPPAAPVTPPPVAPVQPVPPIAASSDPVAALLVDDSDKAPEPLEVAAINPSPPAIAPTAERSEPTPPISDPTDATDMITSRPLASPPASEEDNETYQILGPARQAIQSFLQAETWEQRLPYIHNSEQLKPLIQSYYADHGDGAILDYRLDFFHNERDGDGPNIYVFFLTLPSEEGFPILLREEEKGKCQLDWELFVEFNDRKFTEYVDSQSKDPRSFRVVIQRVTYWEPDRNQIPNVDSLICYKIDAPYPGVTQFAFVPKDTERGKEMTADLSWENEPLAAEVEFRWDEFENGRKYLTVESIVNRSWVRPE